MNASDKPEKKRRGPKPKQKEEEVKVEAAEEKLAESLEKPADEQQDPVSPHHVARLKEQKEAEGRKEQNKIVDKYYEIVSSSSGNKLSLCRRKKGGNVYRTFIGNIKKPEVKLYYDKIREEGKFKIIQK